MLWVLARCKCLGVGNNSRHYFYEKTSVLPLRHFKGSKYFIFISIKGGIVDKCDSGYFLLVGYHLPCVDSFLKTSQRRRYFWNPNYILKICFKLRINVVGILFNNFEANYKSIDKD